jgi:hypothetical protein
MAIVKSTDKNQQALRNCLHYITNDKKASNVSFSDGDVFGSVDFTADLFEQIRLLHNRKGKIFAHHYVQSFSPEDKITPEQAHKIGLEFAKKAFPNFVAIVATHHDKEHIHNHILLNAYSSTCDYKWNDNNETRKQLQGISDELCVKINLSVIENRGNGLDQTTYQLALQGKSWKFKLSCDLDEAMKFCTSKDEFINFLYLRGYDVKFTEKNITITKEGQKKGIRVDTLAKQFGAKYKKLNLEKAMNFWERPKEFIRIEKTKKPVNVRFESEFQRFEKYLFEQINKPEITETEKSVSNFSLKEILESFGKNFMGEIDLLELVKLKELDFLFYAEKFKDTAVVATKNYNAEKLKSQVNILTKADKILVKQRNLNNKIYAEICATAERNNEKPCYRVVNENQFNRLKNSNLKFAYFPKDENYNIVFNKKDEETFNYALKAKGLYQ